MMKGYDFLVWFFDIYSGFISMISTLRATDSVKSSQIDQPLILGTA